MKKKLNTKKLVFKKVTITNLEMNHVLGGLAAINTVAQTEDYSECGTGPATIMPCMCPTFEYSDCGTAPATMVPCLCGPNPELD